MVWYRPRISLKFYTFAKECQSQQQQQPENEEKRNLNYDEMILNKEQYSGYSYEFHFLCNRRKYKIVI